MIKTIAKLPMRGLVILLKRFIPARKGLFVFAHDGANSAYTSNAIALFEYFRTTGREVRWLYDKTPPSFLPPSPCHVRQRSLAGLWTLLRSDTVFITKGFNDFGLWKRLAKACHVVDLGHGIGIKSQAPLQFGGAIKRKGKTRKPAKASYCNMTIASSDIHRHEIAAYTMRPVPTIHVTGLPRNDHFLRIRRQYVNDRTQNTPRNVLYAPTFRDVQNSMDRLFFPFTDFDADTLEQCLRRRNTRMLLRPHYYDSNSMKLVAELAAAHPATFVSATEADIPDTIEAMASADVVVTDYSSIYIDTLLADIPCIFVPFDLDEYCSIRGLCYAYDLVTPGPKVNTQRAFIEEIEAALDGGEDWQQQRQFVRNMFHLYQDGNACQRIARLVDERL